MTNSLSFRKLHLTLEPQHVLPSHLCWKIEDGYVRANTWTQDGDVITIGLWGPGDLVAPHDREWGAAERVSLTRVSLEEISPSPEQLGACLSSQLAQAISLLQISRLRPVEARILNLLHWLGSRFGIVNSQGTVLSLEEMNLTHRALADLSGMTRVSVTKALSSFKSSGLIVRQGELDLLLPHRSQGQAPAL
jgi:CRP-like cAMP-binding protein